MLHVSLQVRRGSFQLTASVHFPAGINALLGPSGAGKSTLLRAIAGLEPATGHVTAEGRELETLAVHRRGIGYLQQRSALLPHLKVADNLGFARQRGPKPLDNARYDELLDELALTPLLGKQPGQLSGGQQQRVALAQALAGGARILLLDEPCTGLDHEAHERFLAYLRKLCRHHPLCVLMVTHQLWEAARSADNASRIENGHVHELMAINTLLCQAPLATRRDALAALDLKSQSFSETDELLTLEHGLQIPAAAGEHQTEPERRLLIPAQSVTLMTGNNDHGSARNVLPATVQSILPGSAGEETIILDTAAGRLIARITRRSRQDLNLSAGSRVVAQIKATAVL